MQKMQKKQPSVHGSSFRTVSERFFAYDCDVSFLKNCHVAST